MTSSDTNAQSRYSGALFLLVAAYVLCVIAGAAGAYTCVNDQDSMEEFVYWLMEVAAYSPVSLMVAWVLANQRRFNFDLPLHKWTWRYGITSALVAGTAPFFPWLLLCHPGYPEQVVHTVHGNGYFFGKVVSWFLLEHKLRVLGSKRLANLTRVYAICNGVLVLPTTLILFMPETLSLSPSQSDFLMMAMWFVTFVTGGMAFGITFGFLALRAARGLRSSNKAKKNAAKWVALTAVVFMGSFTSFGVSTYSVWAWGPGPGWVAALFVDTTLDCISVVVFSGLVGPPGLRRLAREAFSAINTYDDDHLQSFYEGYLKYLDDAQIKWVRCGFLRQLAQSGRLLMRCQDVPASEKIVGSVGFPRSRTDRKGRFVCSHPWLSKWHPDPAGVKLRTLVEQLDKLSACDDDAVFMDFISIPQHDFQNPELRLLDSQGSWPMPGTHAAVRTLEEETLFRKSLGSFEVMYSVSSTPVIVLPMSECLDEGSSPYINRGWCYFEFCLSLSFENIINANTLQSVRKLCDDVNAEEGDTVQGFRVAFSSKVFTESGDRDFVKSLFENTLARKVI